MMDDCYHTGFDIKYSKVRTIVGNGVASKYQSENLANISEHFREV